MKNQFKIENREIDDASATYFIADIGANHDGDLVRAKELIHMCADAGAEGQRGQDHHVDADAGRDGCVTLTTLSMETTRRTGRFLRIPLMRSISCIRPAVNGWQLTGRNSCTPRIDDLDMSIDDTVFQGKCMI